MPKIAQQGVRTDNFGARVLSQGLVALAAVLQIPLAFATNWHPGVVSGAMAFLIVAGLHFLRLLTLPPLTGVVVGAALALLNRSPGACFLLSTLAGLAIGLINQTMQVMEDSDWHGWS